MMVKGILLIVLLILGAFLAADVKYKENKEQEYQNDERWQLIVTKSNKVLMLYFYAIFSLFTLGSIFFEVADYSSPTVALSLVFKCGFYLSLSKYLIEYVALKYYDNRL